jgi:putative nucleotidyltransferase with HDIG domain
MVTVNDPKLKQEMLLRVIAAQLNDLPPLPAVIMRVMETLNDPKTSASDLNRLISADQGIASKLLRLVNSSYYGFSRRASTVTDAVVILGFNAVRDLATSLGAFNAFRARRGTTALEREDFWAHSLATAVAASVIARYKCIPARAMEEVFIGGLLHDVGKLFLDQYFPQQYDVVIKVAAVGGISIWEAEKKALGVGHGLVGKRVAESWRFPLSLTSMISMHHQPVQAPEEYRVITSIINAADVVARTLAIGFPGDLLIPKIDPDAEKLLAIPAVGWGQIRAETTRKFEEAKDFLKIATT